MSSIFPFIRLLRPHQYIKNGFIAAPIIFGNKLFNIDAVSKTAIAFGAFCLLASVIYILNDINDILDDRRHPIKKKRPLASGQVNIFQAVIIAGFLLVLSFGIPLLFLPKGALGVMAAYVVMNLAYSFGLKHRPIIDIVCIAIGFVLRIFLGGKATGISISPWIVIMTFLLALFIGLAKRYDDLLLFHQGHVVRKAMDGYNDQFIALAMGIMASVTIVAYILYTVSPPVVEKHGPHLYVTGFWVVCGFLRYLQITFVEQKSGSPTWVLWHDRVLQGTIFLWLVNIYYLLYW